MMIITRGVMSLAIMAAVAGTAFLPIEAHAQAGTGVIPPAPPAELSQLQAPNANVQQVSVSIATNNPVDTTSVLQSSVGVLGGATVAGANAVLNFANVAKGLIVPAAGHNPSLAAAFAIGVENVYGAPYNAALVNGANTTAIMAQAKAIADA